MLILILTKEEAILESRKLDWTYANEVSDALYEKITKSIDEAERDNQF